MPEPTAPDPIAPDSPVRVEVSGGVATLTLVDEAHRNTLRAPTVAALLDGIARADADPDTRVVVLTNTGRVFCAGADLSSAGAPATPGAAGLDDLLLAMLRSRTPIVGRIDGHAVAGGMGLVAACDIVVARDDALFGFTEVRVGVAPAMISVVCLPKLRRADALEAFLRGNRFPAARAAELGLVNHAVPAADLDATVAEVVADLRLGGPDALAAAKALVYDVPGLPLDEAFRVTAARSAELFTGPEAAAGMAAFLAKEPPPWAG